MLTDNEISDIKFWRKLGDAYEKRLKRVIDGYYGEFDCARGICNFIDDIKDMGTYSSSVKALRLNYHLHFIGYPGGYKYFWFDPLNESYTIRERAFDLRATACYLIADAIEQGMMW